MADNGERREVAAVDLGSNSFHLVVARVHDGHLTVLDRLREPVRLAAGLTAEKGLDTAARERALACLARFGQRLQPLPPEAVRIVGTNTLRSARAATAFVEEAEALLGHEIEVISGFEEARLIYLGVAHSLAEGGERRLVVDIGGGSTELVLGERLVPGYMESLHMGCVSFTQRFFPDGRITRRAMEEARMAALMELEPVQGHFLARGWDRAVGASGTIRAIAGALREQGWTDGTVTFAGLQRLTKALCKAGSLDDIDFKGVSQRRAQVLPGGVAVLGAVFEALGIEGMEAADGALREGVLYDLVGRIRHQDVREATVEALAARYHVDVAHARRVERTATALLCDVAAEWALEDAAAARMLAWAAWLHEVGLDISHSQYHKHGAYILHYSDMPGFSREEQVKLAALVRVHRRKFAASAFRDLHGERARRARGLAVLLRLAVLLHRGRGAAALPAVRLAAEGADRLRLTFPEGWLDDYPLAAADLAAEQDYLASAGVELVVGG
ncbi:Exopolyphosphatase [wastewater metagenome]|uniref:Exopolyphosphatase n=2 Tax=unclassified sequences TaxID=12908 RepID=A0A5B8R6M7_9ZZZZ|nr:MULTISPECIES: exopolyphosphatase [Arhodomonas]MCS4503720.1 exopolyphosphatase [Arhodomonas aquaeolei]QEA04669.1 exopolyphosphatase [uncultured organism]